MKKVLYVSPVGHIGGAEKCLLQLIKHHKRFEPYLLCLRDGPLAQIANFKIEVTRLLHPNTPFAISKIRSIIKKLKPDIVVGNIAYAQIYSSVSSLFLAKKIFFPHATLQIKLKDIKGTLIYLAALGLPYDKIWVGSYFSKKSIEKICPSNKIQVVYPGIELERFEKLQTKETKSKKDGIKIFSHGRIHPSKGFHFLLEVVKKLPNCLLLIAGEAHSPIEKRYKDFLLREADKIGIKERVKFLGWSAEPEKYAVECDILVYPFDRRVGEESFPLAVLEGMACSKPVIVNPSGGIAEYAKNMQNCIFTNSHPDDILQKILLILKNRELSEFISENAYETAKAFTVERFVEGIENMFFSVLS